MSSNETATDWDRAMLYLHRYKLTVNANQTITAIDKAAVAGCVFAYQKLYDAGCRDDLLLRAILELE
jgi:hypothetical protein